MTQGQQKTVGLAIASLICGLFFLIPLLGFLLGIPAIICGIIALSKISKDKENLKGKGMAISGIVMGSLSVVLIPIIGILAAIAIPNLLRAKIAANDALAESTLRSISTAAETYATSNSGQYPTSMDDMLFAEPPYLNEDYCGQELTGYIYNCSFWPDGYEIIATPTEMGMSGTSAISIREGGVLQEIMDPSMQHYEMDYQ